ncbi:hypothetical protein OsI_15156 [Oryza sativa Indica Group]|uniref:Uncharacterized protein n=2 Tax=Oryza sativa TaxID=4530 RepID=B9FE61_ORYSJ|nr:hypothetical protein OsI_15156 [Oryza sativa Indica Group]EEE60644.1 hypothetical protein OsJ_14087 [Oryza sativa Japonica Group]
MGGRYLHRSICQRRTSLIRRQPQPLPPRSVVLPSFLVIFTSRCLYIDRIDNSKVEYNDNLESTLIGGGLAP